MSDEERFKFNFHQESTDDEEAGYETDEYFDEQGRKVIEIDYSNVPYAGPSVPPAPKQEPVPVTVVARNDFACEMPPPPKREAASAFTENDFDGGCFQPPPEKKMAPSVPMNELRNLMPPGGAPSKNDSNNNVSSETAARKMLGIPVEPMGEIRYTMADMTPTIRDPRCSSETELACFWPVYVGNFKDTDVAKYFASKGLYVRWFYRREDYYFREFQDKMRLYDMLVYFVSERDAQLAIERCHRDQHRGYTLNVFPGREPVYFREDRSVYAQNMKRGHIYSEHFLEQHVRLHCNLKLKCVVKFDMENCAIEFFSPGDVYLAQQREREKLWKYQPVKGKMKKQRFLEKDVLKDIEAKLVADPTLLQIKRTDKCMKILLAGMRPVYDAGARYRLIPLRRGPGKKTQMTLRKKKMKKMYGADGF